MLVDPDKMGTTFVKIFALEFFAIGTTGFLMYYFFK
ncbi:MAG: hypothetical protein BWY51_00299 [Parcubacteria group bacterium ADurb.Bin316]|nr:MAG: hypothetical protein BWY51_00299 [Parcubacteria group bacterium ADurb.Bin316]